MKPQHADTAVTCSTVWSMVNYGHLHNGMSPPQVLAAAAVNVRAHSALIAPTEFPTGLTTPLSIPR